MHIVAHRIPVKHAVPVIVTAALTAAAVLGGGGAQADPVTAAPSADQLTKQLSVIFDTNASSTQRASYLEAGDAALPAVNSLAGPIAQHRSMVSMQVENPAIDGDHLTSQLVMSVMGMGSQRRPLDWVEQNGLWKLSKGSLCNILKEVARDDNCPL